MLLLLLCMLPCYFLLLQVLSWTCDPVGDGIMWPVVKGCDQYTLTVSRANSVKVCLFNLKCYTWVTEKLEILRLMFV
jgi:hypothetical protein